MPPLSPSPWSPPKLLAGEDDLASERRQWKALAPDARWAAVREWISRDPDWVAGVGDDAMEAWARAFRALGPDGARAMASHEAGEAPDFPEPLADAVDRRRWRQVAERWGFVRIEAHPDVLREWQACLPAMEAGWAKMTQTLGLPENGLGAGRLSLMLDSACQHSAFDRLTQTIRLGQADSQSSGFLHEWLHGLDAWLGQCHREPGAPSKFAKPLSLTQPEMAFPQEESLPVWERYQGIWAAWGAAWRSWSTTLSAEQGSAARAWWVQAERMQRRGALSEQALRPLHLFLDSLPSDARVRMFQAWLVDPQPVPQNPWRWAAQHLDRAEGQPYLSLPQELWARGVQGLLAREMGQSWTHERSDHAALFPVMGIARQWQTHWQQQWPSWRQAWLTQPFLAAHAGVQP